MKLDKPSAPEILTLERIHKNVSSIVFSALFFFVAAILFSASGQQTTTLNVLNSAAAICVLLSFLFFIVALADITLYYLAISVKFVRVNFQKYKYWYYGAAVAVPIVGVFIFGWYVLERQNFWMVSIGAVLALCAWGAKRWYAGWRKERAKTPAVPKKRVKK